MYAACMTRGDVAYHTSFLSQFSKLPFQEAWEALVRLLVCLYATRKHALTFGGKEIKIPDAPTCKPKLNPSSPGGLESWMHIPRKHVFRLAGIVYVHFRRGELR